MTIMNMVGGGSASEVNTVAGRTFVGTPSDFGMASAQSDIDVGISTFEYLRNSISGFVRTSPTSGFGVSGSAVMFYEQNGMNMDVVSTVNAPASVTFIGDDENGNYLFKSGASGTYTIYRIDKTTKSLDTFLSVTEHSPELITKGHPFYISSSEGLLMYENGEWSSVGASITSGEVSGGNYPYIFVSIDGQSPNYYNRWDLYDVSTGTASFVGRYRADSTGSGTYASSQPAICLDGTVVRDVTTYHRGNPPFVYSDGTVAAGVRDVYGTNVIIYVATSGSTIYWVIDGVEHSVASGSRVTASDIVRMIVSDEQDLGASPLNVQGRIFARTPTST